MTITQEIVDVDEVVFEEPCGRVYRIKVGLKIEKEWLEELCKDIIGDLYHLEMKPVYELVLT